MKSPALLVWFFLVVNLQAAGDFAGPARQLSSEVRRYVRADFQADVSAVYPNPYDQRLVAVDLLVTTPTGKQLVQPCFLDHQGAGRSTWDARFAPRESGTFSYVFQLKEQGLVVATTERMSFTTKGSQGDGFLHANNVWTFVLDSGKPFRGLGENVGWESRSYESSAYSYDLFLPELSKNGANIFRTWSCAWNLPLEWKRVTDTTRYSNTNEIYHPQGVQRLDELTALCESLGLKFMFCLDQHGSLLASGQWPLSNYNSANGGPCATPNEFFTKSEAKELYKNRLRFIVARWGCSTSVGAWELFNEIDNAVFDGGLSQTAVTLWHSEMSAYLKDIDPYHHLVTTSISWRDVAGIYDVPTIDFNQRHTYNNTAAIPAVISQYLQQNQKPFVVGEFAWDWDWNHLTAANAPSFDYDFKYGMWYGLFSPTPIVPMSWWWEMFHEHGLIPYVNGLRNINDRMLAAGNGAFTPVYPVSPAGLHVMGVQCGQTIFVHAHNNGAATVAGTIGIPLAATSAFVLEAFDPETGVTSKWGTVTPASGNVTIPASTLSPHEERIYILTAPTTVLQQPQSLGAALGERAVFHVDAANGTAFQWNKDGQPVPGATDATLVLTGVSASDAASYTCTVSGLSGDVTSVPASLTVVPSGSLRLKNISTRSRVGTGNDIQIGGFSIRGGDPKRVLIRAAGPGLAAFNVTGVLEDPILAVYSGQTLLFSNDDWDSALAPVFVGAGAFAWTPGSKDAALAVTLPQGSYTVQVRGKNSGTGTALMEVYDIDDVSTSVLANLSTRSLVGSGDALQIAGFVTSGPASKRVILRAGGPALEPFGLPDLLADPALQIFSDTVPLFQNEDWSAWLAPEFALVGAFEWPLGSTDAALMLALPPGAYTAHVTGRDNGTGVAIAEVYEAR